MFKFSKRSVNNLVGVHPDLVRVAYRSLQLTDIDFVVIDGTRTAAEAAANLAKGTSQTKHSKHLLGRAIDLNPCKDGVIYSGDTPKNYLYFDQLSIWVLKAAKELGVPVEWGGNWRTWQDRYHYQLPDSFK